MLKATCEHNTDRTNEKPALGFMIPEFPQQTHIAWWRVAHKLRELGQPVQFLSTRAAPVHTRVHEDLNHELKNTFFSWPPSALALLRESIQNLAGVRRAFKYLISLEESSWKEKIKLLPVLASAVNLSSYLRKQNIKVVFVHSCANAAHLVAMSNRISSIRYALRLGGDPSVYGKDHFHKMQFADYILSASPTYFGELVDRHGVDREKLFWTWVGTSLKEYSASASWPKLVDPNKIKVISVSRLHPAKGHSFALKAIGDLVSDGVPLEYTIVGSGSFRAEIESLIEEYRLTKNVKLVGARDAKEVADLLKDSDVFLLPSSGIGEAAPAVICEAMASGLAVICTRIGATEQMITDTVDGFLVPQKDSASIRDSLRLLSYNPGRLEAMKRAARKNSLKFDVQITAELILDLLSKNAADKQF